MTAKFMCEMLARIEVGPIAIDRQEQFDFKYLLRMRFARPVEGSLYEVGITKDGRDFLQKHRGKFEKEC